MTAKNIHEAINAVMQEVGYVKKQKAGGLNYSFAGEAALIAAIRPTMVEQGIYMTVDSIQEVRRENYTTKSGTPMVNTVIHGSIAFRHSATDTFIVVQSIGEGSDAGDKSANKAMTGMYKYALRQTFCIETGDDPDKFASEERAPAPETLRERYAKLYAHAVALKVPEVENYAITDKMTDDEVRSLGIDLKAKVEAAEKAGK